MFLKNSGLESKFWVKNSAKFLFRDDFPEEGKS